MPVPVDFFAEDCLPADLMVCIRDQLIACEQGTALAASMRPVLAARSDGDRWAAFRRVAAAVWSDLDLLRQPMPATMRSFLRFAAGLDPGEALLAVMRMLVADDTCPWVSCCAVHDGRLWIPDLLLLQLDYWLELELDGTGPAAMAARRDDGFDCLAHEGAGIGAVLWAFLTWLEGAEPQRGWVLDEQSIVPLPACGLCLQSTRVRPILAAWRARHAVHAVMVAAEPPDPLSFWRLRYPASLEDGGQRLDHQVSVLAQRQAGGVGRVLGGMGPTEAEQAVRSLLIDVITSLADQRGEVRDGALVVPLRHQRYRLAELMFIATRHGVAMHASGVGAVLLLTGLTIGGWVRRPDRDQASFSYETLVYSGLGPLLDTTFPLQFEGGPSGPSTPGPWLVIPELATSLPVVSLGARVLATDYGPCRPQHILGYAA